jgi:2-polyprenyl-3-methyl-5-hydroxy-6-metoxy-1,4-benzoquinol methylase
MSETVQVSATAQATAVRCPICEGPLRATHIAGRDRLITGEGPFTVRECPDCEFGLTFPQLADEELGRYYPSEYYEGFCEYSGPLDDNPLYRLRERFRTWSAERRYERAPFGLGGRAPARMLDVGCGDGDLLEHFAKQGWETYGIDPSAEAVEAAARRGAKVHQGTLRDQPWPEGSFAVITFQHALEHISDPVDALRRARALLEPGGLLVIAVPNWACWQRRYLFRSRWSPLDMPRHVQHFSPRAFERLAALLGLKVREVGSSSSAPVAAYSLHYVLFGRLTSGWRLWLSYALGILMLPLVFLGDHFGGGDACFVVMEASREQSARD